MNLEGKKQRFNSFLAATFEHLKMHPFSFYKNVYVSYILQGIVKVSI